MDRRARLSEAAATLRACRAAFAARGGSAVREVLDGGAGDIVEWRHYPDGEAYDPSTHAQYFFHRHPGPGPGRQDGAAESGHFHLFLRGDGIPDGIAPLLLPEAAVANAPLPRQSAPLKRGSRDEVCHLVAIAVDQSGEPVRLFTTNRWVTGETWYSADDVIALLDRFRFDGDQPSALLNRWLAALVRLFAADIAALLRARDKTVLEWRWRGRGNVLEDPRLEVPSNRAINLDSRLAEVERADDARPRPAPGPARHLPRMAEGWGA